jgi:predicted CoA-binding protein
MTPGALVEDEAAVTAIARDMRTVAVLGIKDERDPFAPAYSIPHLLAESGVHVIGVNPMVKEALGQPTLASLAELPAGIDVLDVFRRSDAIPGIADQLLALPAERRPAVVWLQTGIRHDEAAARLVAAGYRVVQDRCLGVYARRARRRH